MITVDEGAETPEKNWESLVKNESSTKEFQGKTVTFQHPELIAEKSTTLFFDLHEDTPLPYLGALGHLVVLDEQGTRFIHVHPTSNDQTVFEAQFPSPGFYKLWAEFKFADTGVFVFPFIVEVAKRR